MPSQDHASSAPPSPPPPPPGRSAVVTGKHPAWRPEPDDMSLEATAYRAARAERIGEEVRGNLGQPPNPMVKDDKGTGALGLLFELGGKLDAHRLEVRAEIGGLRDGLSDLTTAVNTSEAARAAAATAAAAKAKADLDAAAAAKLLDDARGGAPQNWWVRSVALAAIGITIAAAGGVLHAFVASHVILK